ncbi:hypothetical protein EVG20_g3891 [Dentipellis fragilis]|uniref:Uncharacterized protein n=1 Tax=Dentipellis fragilis TaxID=205917 RepID=A0A4Y9YZA8_9AGAM|nr:hypothetical protein EVG20_g3891 [Dentipellis fragilis]
MDMQTLFNLVINECINNVQGGRSPERTPPPQCSPGRNLVANETLEDGNEVPNARHGTFDHPIREPSAPEESNPLNNAIQNMEDRVAHADGDWHHPQDRHATPAEAVMPSPIQPLDASPAPVEHKYNDRPRSRPAVARSSLTGPQSSAPIVDVEMHMHISVSHPLPLQIGSESLCAPVTSAGGRVTYRDRQEKGRG